MKLFSPKHAKIAHNHKQEDDIKQIAFLSIQLKKLQDSINKENTNWELRLKEQRDLYTKEKIKLQEEVRVLEEKIKAGEERMIQLLIPVKGLRERAQKALSRAQETAKSIMTREEEVNDLQERLTDKIDSLTERETNVSENEIKIESRLKGIEEEAQMISKSHKMLNDKIKVFEANRISKETKIKEGENSLLVREKRIKEYLENRAQELDEKERALKDKREALDRGFAELERLKEKLTK